MSNPELSALQTAILCQAFSQAADETATQILKSNAMAADMIGESDDNMIVRLSKAWGQVVDLGLITAEEGNRDRVNFEPHAYETLRENLERHGFRLGGGE